MRVRASGRKDGQVPYAPIPGFSNHNSVTTDNRAFFFYIFVQLVPTIISNSKFSIQQRVSFILFSIVNNSWMIRHHRLISLLARKSASCHDADFAVTGGCHNNVLQESQWQQPRVVMMPTLSSLAPEVANFLEGQVAEQHPHMKPVATMRELSWCQLCRHWRHRRLSRQRRTLPWKHQGPVSI